MGNIFGEVPGQKPRNVHLPQLALDFFLHLLNGKIGFGELSFLVTVAAVVVHKLTSCFPLTRKVISIFGVVGVGTAVTFVLGERHAA